ncbi:hypothetical protein [Pelagibaculum spongiae]|uniref:Uncharacterized protein n=1 Tax=Pelagibaculum spongiae TaxID=2080658 RepID=A0A2V1GSN1_9GAMM|nr:hypothetical protein [Pelagibaculum spongiae]PVZ66376.1 hypothetical protein DC094_16915 [Pelagibaculum spongiae]
MSQLYINLLLGEAACTYINQNLGIIAPNKPDHLEKLQRFNKLVDITNNPFNEPNSYCNMSIPTIKAHVVEKLLSNRDRHDTSTPESKLRSSVALSKQSGIGQCNEMSYIAIDFLSKKQHNFTLKFCEADFMHVFVLIGSTMNNDTKIDLNNPDITTIGADTIICDPWHDRCFSIFTTSGTVNRFFKPQMKEILELCGGGDNILDGYFYAYPTPYQ